MPEPTAQFSFSLYGTPPDNFVPLACHAEEAGFEAAWLGDHVLAPARVKSRYPYAPFGTQANPMDGTPLGDVWTAIGAMLRATSRIHVGTGVYILPMRRPFVTALAAATAQTMSGGRFLLGVGTGWLREEFELLGEDFDSRGPRTDEITTILRRLWTGEPSSFSGRYYEFADIRSAKPSSPVPILFGGSAAPALRRTAEMGDGWYSTGDLTLDEAVDVRDRVDAMRAAAGRAGEPFTYYIRMTGEQTAENAARYVEHGFRHLTLGTNAMWRGASGAADRMTVLDRLRDDLVVPFLG